MYTGGWMQAHFNRRQRGGRRDVNEGNQGAELLVAAIRRIAGGQIPADRKIDFGTIRSDYSLVTDTFPVPIPRGEWSALKYMSAEGGGESTIPEVVEIKERLALHPGDRVLISWVGNEAVVTGVLTKL